MLAILKYDCTIEYLRKNTLDIVGCYWTDFTYEYINRENINEFIKNDKNDVIIYDYGIINTVRIEPMTYIDDKFQEEIREDMEQYFKNIEANQKGVIY